MIKKENQIFFNQSFDKKRLKALISWVFKKYGEAEALKVLDLLKETGFRNATKAGISIGLHDLTTPVTKSWLISESQQSMNNTEIDFVGAKITATERSQRIIDTWHRASESLSKQVVDYFNVYDRFNPVYIMALSGARGNFSQVRQLIGMRGLMADQQGKIVNFPIRSNLREGLTIIEYFISCSGARKGLVDTALRTADTGYLTRRLVDVSHHVVVKRIRCNTSRGIQFKDLQSYNKILLSLKERLVGRVLAENISVKSTVPHRNLTCAQRAKEFVPRAQAYTCNTNLRFVLGATGGRDVLPRSFGVKKGTSQIEDLCRTDQKMHGKANNLLAKKDTEISPKLSAEITQHRNKVLIRSPLTCGLTHEVCQLCYGWSISQGSLVSLGDAVGVIAAQSIGEPGTQLTMRTFHTGGVFSGDLLQEIRAPHAGQIEFPKAFQGLLIRTGHGRIAFLSKTSGSLILKNYTGSSEVATPKSLASQPEGLLEVPNRSHLSCARTPHTFGVKVCEAKIRQLNSTTIPIKPFTMLFVRQNEKVDVNQLLAEFSIQSKEGNQPIKTQQTIFAELSGRVIEDYSGKTYLKYLKESSFLVDNLQHYLSQLVQSPPKSDLYSPQSLAPTNCRALRFALAPIAPEGHEHGHSACSPSCPEGAWQSEQEGARVSAVVPFDNKETLKTHARCKPIGKPQAQFFNSAHKESNAINQFLTLYKREDLENDTFRYVEPVKSGRLGLLKILSIRIGATFNYTCPLQFSAFSNYLQNLGHFANGLNPYRLFYTPQKLKVSVARAPFLLRLPLHISPHSARPFALAPKEHGVQEKLDVWGTRTYTCKRHGKIDELPLQPLKLYNNSLRCFKNNKPLYVSSIKDGNKDLCGAPTLKGLKKKDGVNAYLHPELIKENRFFLQTIAEYGDIVEEGYKNKILKSP